MSESNSERRYNDLLRKLRERVRAGDEKAKVVEKHLEHAARVFEGEFDLRAYAKRRGLVAITYKGSMA